MQISKNPDDDWSPDCLDCGVNTMAIDEYYMVEGDLWRLATRGTDGAGMLCLGCLEARIGFPLVASDFIDAPINKGFFPRSPRFLSRLSRT